MLYIFEIFSRNFYSHVGFERVCTAERGPVGGTGYLGMADGTMRYL